MFQYYFFPSAAHKAPSTWALHLPDDRNIPTMDVAPGLSSWSNDHCIVILC